MIVSWATPDSGSPLQKEVALRKNFVSDTLVISEDIFPTVCRWARVEIAEQTLANIDGIDFTDAAIDPASSTDRSLLFHYPHVWGPKGDGYQPHSSLRNGKWKIIYFYHTRTWELYDLKADISETVNLMEQQPEIGEKMKALLKQKLTAHDAQYPVVIASGQPEQPE